MDWEMSGPSWSTVLGSLYILKTSIKEIKTMTIIVAANPTLMIIFSIPVNAVMRNNE